MAVLAFALLFCLPWVDLLIRVRQTDLPIKRLLRRRILPENEDPFLAASAAEIQEVGTFKDTSDWGYEWNGAEHFFRLYYVTETRTQTVVCLTEDELRTIRSTPPRTIPSRRALSKVQITVSIGTELRSLSMGFLALT